MRPIGDRRKRAALFLHFVSTSAAQRGDSAGLAPCYNKSHADSHLKVWTRNSSIQQARFAFANTPTLKRICIFSARTSNRSLCRCGHALCPALPTGVWRTVCIFPRYYSPLARLATAVYFCHWHVPITPCGSACPKHSMRACRPEENLPRTR
eukprot:scaffold97629_cov28-Tisochrysis_lutea.AAC.1